MKKNARKQASTETPLKKAKVSFAIGPELLQWVESRAKNRGRSLSAVIVEAIEQQRRQEAWESYLAAGGENDITPENVEALVAELRAGGMKI